MVWYGMVRIGVRVHFEYFAEEVRLEYSKYVVVCYGMVWHGVIWHGVM